MELKQRYKSLGTSFYGKFYGETLENLELIHTNESFQNDLNLQDTNILNELGVNIPPFNGVATVYSGHQFGHYVERLGDGRAVLLGEIEDKNKQFWEVQVKGSGPTEYSRGFDGQAVLRSTIREYLCSEAMHNLGIPTTRSLAIMKSDSLVQRETFENAARLIRLAPTHIRFGTFEYFFHRKEYD